MNNHYVLSDIVEAIRAGKRTEAYALISHFIENKFEFKDEWQKISILATGIGEIDLARQSAELFYCSVAKNADTAVRCAGLYAELGDLTKALQIVKPYLEANAALPSVYHLAGTIKAQLGDLPQARLYLLQAIALAPQLGITWFTLANIVDFNQHPGLLQRLEFVFNHLSLDDARNKQQFSYALAKAYDDCGDYAKAWQLYNTGASLMKSLIPYSAAKNKHEIDQIIANFNSERLLPLPQSRSTYQNTVAILGLPRSGTTLLGQMLLAHSNVQGAGEFNAIGAACIHLQGENFTNFPAFIARHGHPISALDHIAAVYQHVAEQHFNKHGYIIDKSLNLNRYFGVFAQSLPQAKAIYIRRNENDIAWSCFKSNFRSGAAWSWDPIDILAYIIQEQRLLQHWQMLYPNRILVIDYEDLVNTPEPVLNKVCKYLGLQYEPEMLHFYKSRSPVLTSSIGQVHKPLHKNSIGLATRYPDFISQLATAR